MTFKLTPDDLAQPVVKKLREFMQTELARWREHNDVKRDNEATEFTRGRIRELKDLLVVVTPPAEE